MRVRLMLWHDANGEHRSALVGEGRKRLNVLRMDATRLRVRHVKKNEIEHMRPLRDMGRALNHFREAETQYGASNEARRLIAAAEFEAGRGELPV